MRSMAKVAVSLSLVCFIVFASSVFAAEKTIVLPQGTKAQKIGAGHFKFKLPNGQVVEVRNLVLPGKVLSNTGPRAIIGDSGVFDVSGKKVAAGRQGTLTGGAEAGAVRQEASQEGGGRDRRRNHVGEDRRRDHLGDETGRYRRLPPRDAADPAGPGHRPGSAVIARTRDEGGHATHPAVRSSGRTQRVEEIDSRR